MPKLLLCCGISASGKSTFAENLVKEGPSWVEINRDNFRFKLFTNGVRDWSLYKFSKEKEKEVDRQCEILWLCAVNSGKNVVVSNTNLNIKYHNQWRELAEQEGYKFEVKYFPISLEDAIKRDDKRLNGVGREVIIQQYQQWMELTDFKKYIPDENKPKAILIDIDGTVALTTTRSHYDYSNEAVLTDKPRLDIINMVTAFIEREDLIPIFMSGRSDICREGTLKWLSDYFDTVPYLFMRKDGDNRNDKIVKSELFWDNVADHFNVIMAVDDRPRIVRLWNDTGIENVISVQKGYNEF